MIIEVKQFKGIATNADPTDIGLEFSRDNQNFSLDTFGTLTKQKGRGSATDIASVRLSQLIYWSPSNLDTSNAEIPAIWVGFDGHNNKLKKLNSNFSSPQDLGSQLSVTSRVDLNDHGQDFRMASDNLSNKVKILQHISRKYFEGAVTIDDYVFQDATPTRPPESQLVIRKIESITVGSDSGLSLGKSSGTTLYNYKISAIFDGGQELPLGDGYSNIEFSDNTKCSKLSIEFPNLTSSGTSPNKTYSFNPRISSFKIYRETDDNNNFYQIIEIPINTASDTDNIIVSHSNDSSTYLPTIDYGFSNTLIDDNTAVKHSSGVFSTPNQTVPADTISARYVWKHVLRLADGTLDSNSNVEYASSPTIDTSDFATITGAIVKTADFSSVNGPLSNTTFANFVDNGFLKYESIPATSARVNNFNTDTQIRRLLQITRPATGGGTVTEYINSYDYNHTLRNTCWHDKGVGYNMNNNKRWGLNEVNGSISIDHSGGEQVVIESVGKVVRVNDISGYTLGQGVDLNKFYALDVGSSVTTYSVYDIGYTNGLPSPYPTNAKVDTRYKYSQMIGDVNFVGNVRLDPGGNLENHPDFVMYSMPGQPDVIPMTNYIRILDQQGGSITGLNRILNNLVVFMTRGIFRLDVSSGEPSLYTLLEVNPNVGCIAPESIVNAKDNLFFCANENMYQIRPDFSFIPISESIEDVYQGISNKADSKVMYDAKRDRLICKFGNTSANIYTYDLLKESWAKMVFTDLSNFEYADFFTINDELNLYGLRVYDPNPSP